MPPSRERQMPRTNQPLFETLEGRTLMSASAGLAGGEVAWALPASSAAPSAAAALSAGPAPSATSTVQPATTAVTPLGGNLYFESDRMPDHPFTDLVKTTRGFYNLAGRVASNGKMALANTDANGWPTEDFAFSVADNSEYHASIAPGTYPMSFTGPAGVSVSIRRTPPAGAVTVPSTTPLPTLKLVSHSSATGTYVYSVTVPQGAQALAFNFTHTGGRVKNIKVLQPGYSLSGYPTFSNDYINLLKNLNPTELRFKDFTHTDNNPVTTWSGRTHTTDATQSKVGTAGDLQPLKGIAWEYCIQLANQLHKDVWINIPAHADDTYIQQLAALVKNKLDPSLKVYVEYSNEVWNSYYEQYRFNLNAAVAQVKAGGSNLNYDGKTDSYTLANRRYAQRSVQISNIFHATFGTQGSRVRAVLCSQIANVSRFDDMLKYVKAKYGSPSTYFYGIGVAPYFNDGKWDYTAGATKTQILSALSASVSAYENGASLTNVKSRANAYGLKMVAYEGGADTFGSINNAAQSAAIKDPSMSTLVQRYLKTWYAHGGDLFNWYVISTQPFNTPYGTYSITDNIHNYYEPKELGFKAIRDAGLGG